MHAHDDQTLHTLTAEKIYAILQYDAWRVPKQALTSAATNDNTHNEPDLTALECGENTEGINAFADIIFAKKVKNILDIGGGQFDVNADYMQRVKNIRLLVWDPYNRPASHNQNVKKFAYKNQIDAATSMSVLNVIQEQESRLAHINTLKAALSLQGKAYFKVWSGHGALKESYFPTTSTSSYQANANADRFFREIEIVFGRGNVAIDKTIPNLIIAIKKRDAHTTLQEIEAIQNQSAKERPYFLKMQHDSLRKIYSKDNIVKLFSANLTLFKSIETAYAESHRHDNERLQQAHDEKYGLVLKM